MAADTKRNLITLLIAVGVCFAASAIGGLLTEPNLPWYETLNQPGFAPPNSAFPIVWPILHAMMAVSVWLLRTYRQNGEVKEVRPIGSYVFTPRVASRTPKAAAMKTSSRCSAIGMSMARFTRFSTTI